MRLEECVAHAPLPVKVAVRTASVIALPFVWGAYQVIAPTISLLPGKLSVKLLGAKDALSNTKKSGLLEAGLALTDFVYELATGDPFLPSYGYSLLATYLWIDGVWRYQRASIGFQKFYETFTPLHAKKPEPRGTLALELPAAVIKRLFD